MQSGYIKLKASNFSEASAMHEHEQQLLKREISRLSQDLERCSDPQYQELIQEYILFLGTVIKNYS